MARSVLLACAIVAGAAGFAPAQPARVHSTDDSGPPDQLRADGVEEVIAAGWVLKRLEAAADEHAQKTTKSPEKRANAVLSAWARVAASRNRLIQRLERSLRVGFADRSVRPEAMLALADLYLDQWATVDRYQFEREDAGEAVGAAHAGDLDKLYVMGREPALEVWERFVLEHPEHPQAPAVLDEISQARADMGDYVAAKRALKQLLCANRSKELAAVEAVQQSAGDQLQARVYANSVTLAGYGGCKAELDDRAARDDAWIRLGRLHRSGTGEQQLAVSAFEQVIEDTESAYYATALQEIADAYYDGGQLLEAIPMLDDLVEHLDSVGDKDPGLLELRGSSLARIGVIIAQLWRASAVSNPDGALKLADIYYHGRSHQQHVREVYVDLGAALHRFGAFEQAIPVWRYAMSGWPRHPETPLVHEALVTLLVEKGDSRAADAERRGLLQGIAEGSPWYRANADNEPAIRTARRLAEETLFTLARNQYRQVAIAAETGGKARAPAQRDLSALHADTIQLFERFLATFPQSKLAYEARFHLARTLYHAERYVDAGRRFYEVSKSGGQSQRYFEQATRMRVAAYEHAEKRAVKSGSLKPPSLPTKKDLGKRAPALPLPAIYAELQSAYEGYADVVMSPEEAARHLLDASRIDLRYRRVDKAEERLRRVVTEYCQTRAAKEARARLAQIYVARDEGGVGTAATRWLSQACGDSKAMLAVRDAKLKKDFAQAEKLWAAGRHEDAGRRYYAAYRLTTASHNLHDDALFKAARGLAEAGKSSAALALLRTFVERPELRKSEYYAESLWLSGQIYARAFDYERAVAAYLRLAALGRDRGYRARPGYDVTSSADEALWNAAELRDLDRVYYDRGRKDPGAATLFERYAVTQKRKRARASEAYLRAGTVYQKAGDVDRLRATFDKWRRAHSRFAGAGHYELHFNHLIAAALLTRGDRQGASKAFASVVSAFDRARGKPGSREADLAAEAQFWLAEEAYRKHFKNYLFQWPEGMATDLAASEKQIRALVEANARARSEFDKVHRFGSRWSIAAHARTGDVWLDVANKVIDAPLPASFIEAQKKKGGVEALEAIVEEIRGAIQPVYDAAAADWNKAAAAARERNVVDKWSKLAQERLNRNIDAGKYPVLRDEIVPQEVLP